MTLPVWLFAADSRDDGLGEVPSTRASGSQPRDATASADRATLDLLCAGNTGALEQVYRTLFPDLVRFAYLVVRSRSVAEEVVQDVFANLWERRDSLEINGSLRGYLFTAVRYRALNVRRAEHTVQRFERNVSDTVANTAVIMGAEAALLSTEEARAIGSAVAQLSEKQRQAVLLRMQSQLAYQEIGAVLGVSPDGARMLVNRALAELRKLLADYIAG